MPSQPSQPPHFSHHCWYFHVFSYDFHFSNPCIIKVKNIFKPCSLCQNSKTFSLLFCPFAKIFYLCKQNSVKLEYLMNV